MELSGIRHTDNPLKTNENILRYDKIDVWSTTVLCNDNTKHYFEYPTVRSFYGLSNIARIVHRFYYYPDDTDAWIIIDCNTGEIKITGNKINNILSLFDSPQQKQSLDELIEGYQNKNYEQIKSRDKSRNKEDGRWY